MWLLNVYFFSPTTTKKRWRFFGTKFNFLFKQTYIKKKKTYSDLKSLFITVQKYCLVFNVYLKIYPESPP